MKILSFALLGVCCSVMSLAQSRKPDNIFLSKLDNGLELLVLEDHSVPLATVEIAVHNGSYTEDPQYNGLSHLYEHMFFKANKDLPSQEQYLERVHELGIVFNGTTSTERVNYFFTLGSKDVADGLKFMNSAIRYPLFLESEMKKENPVVDGEFQRAESSPTFELQDKMNRKLWGSLYSRKNTIGDHNIILTATPEKMRVIKDKYYYPNNSVLVVAGDVDHNDIFRRAKELFGDWKPADFDPFKKWPIPEFQPLAKADSNSFIVTNENARVPIFITSWQGPDTRRDIRNTLVADVFSYILEQQNSKFQKALVDSGYALQANLSYSTQKHVGPITLFFVPNPEKFKESFAVLQRQVDQFDREDYFTDEQLATAKLKLANEEKYGREVTSNYAHTLTYWWASADLDYYFNYQNELNKVTRQEIRDYVRKYIKGQPAVRGLLLHPKMKEQWGVTGTAGLF